MDKWTRVADLNRPRGNQYLHNALIRQPQFPTTLDIMVAALCRTLTAICYALK